MPWAHGLVARRSIHALRSPKPHGSVARRVLHAVNAPFTRWARGAAFGSARRAEEGRGAARPRTLAVRLTGEEEPRGEGPEIRQGEGRREGQGGEEGRPGRDR